MAKLNITVQEDGSIEYYSVWSATTGFHFFASCSDAETFIKNANDHIDSGIQFHKEIDGKSVLPSDLNQ